MLDALRPFLVYFALVIAIVVAMLVLSWLLGQRQSRPAKDYPYESGIVSVGSAHFRISVHFYITAILFIIFDLEVVFLFAWAVAVRENGWAGFLEISVFIFILAVALVYLWRIGALDWRTQTQRRQLRTLHGPGGVTNIAPDTGGRS
ncbi:MAG: NADH-quinone oxidoreductase subunit A [Pseudomonadales bacterium]|nr:NADH-quinone oxidoreductase subunit A [Pseudomonadales bacterium]MCP5358966.1 NADH-quinone oxidoreductase subunit A [Pseudomonadales bacterium]